MKYIFLIPFLVAGTLLANDTKPLEELFEGDYSDYRKHKSLAVVYDKKDSRWIIGIAYRAPNKAVAKRVAIKKCKQAAKKHKLENGCKTFALNNRKYF